MKIGVIADGKEQEGGTKEVINHIKRTFQNSDIGVEYVNEENYLPKVFPIRWKDMFRFFYLRKISNIDFSRYDIVITLQPDSHCIKHKNHVVYFQHHKKQYYDLFWQSLKLKKKLKKKVMFLVLAGAARIADRFYLTPNLKESFVVVNSPVVGNRLKKYNKITSFLVIYPGCDSVKGYSQNSELTTDTTEKRNGITPTLLAFSRLNVVQKGIDIILQTALTMPHYKFIIAGPYDSTIDEIDRKKLPDNVNLMVKEFSAQEKFDLFGNCDSFLAPYLEEDFGITPLEANAFGKPVIYCEDSGGIVFTQKHLETGFMCKRTTTDLANGIEYCIKNREDMRRACIRNSTEYSWGKFEKRFKEYIDKLDFGAS
jgi:glycosyltransferase involved in cell wall biosynthesis